MIFTLSVLVSCSEISSELEAGRKVKLSIALPETKVGIAKEGGSFFWQDGDCISIFNNADESIVSYDVRGAINEVTVPEYATTLYGLYPKIADGGVLSSVPISLPAVQSQIAGGVFPSCNYPLVASSTIINNTAMLEFTPLASILALNIYGTTGSIRAVRVTPLDNTAFVGVASMDLTSTNPVFSTGDASIESIVVTVDNAVPIGVKPVNDAERRSFPGQIYVCLARQEYSRLQIEVDTGGTIWKLTTTDSFKFDCTEKDIIYTVHNSTLYIVFLFTHQFHKRNGIP